MLPCLSMFCVEVLNEMQSVYSIVKHRIIAKNICRTRKRCLFYIMELYVQTVHHKPENQPHVIQYISFTIQTPSVKLIIFSFC